MPETLDDQLTKYLADAHSIEEQALVQLRRAPGIAGDADLARVFEEHVAETEEHERLVRERLEAHGGDPSRTKDVIARAGGVGMILFARSQPDTPGKLTAHAFSYEHMELATYDLLERVAERAGDRETVEVARHIREQERAQAERLGARFDRAVEASLEQVAPDDLGEQLVDYLADAHAIEGQSLELLRNAPGIAGDRELARIFERHAEETDRQRALVEQRVCAHDARPSRFKDAALRVGALDMAAFFGAQPDSPAKLAGFAFAVEHLEIAAYEELLRVAARAGDRDTVAAAERILGEERAAAGAIRSRFDPAVEASLREQGLTA